VELSVGVSVSVGVSGAKVGAEATGERDGMGERGAADGARVDGGAGYAGAGEEDVWGDVEGARSLVEGDVDCRHGGALAGASDEATKGKEEEQS
jgi:hypothetical protein